MPRARSSFFFFLFFFIIFYFFFVIVRSPSSFCGFVFLQYTHTFTHFELSFSFFVSFFGRSPHKYKEKIQTHSPLRLQLLQFKKKRRKQNLDSGTQTQSSHRQADITNSHQYTRSIRIRRESQSNNIQDHQTCTTYYYYYKQILLLLSHTMIQSF